MKIDFEGGRHYYPDLLVEYENFKPVLFEVKFRQELKDSWDVLKSIRYLAFLHTSMGTVRARHRRWPTA